MFSYANFITASDRYNTRGADDQQLQHLSRKLKYPIEDIMRAVQEVGYEPDEVEEYIRDRYNRS